MGLRDIRVEEVATGAGDDVTLEARTGESLEILARGVSGSGNNTIATETVREEDVLGYHADTSDAVVFDESVVHNLKTDLMGKMREMGYTAPTIKVPEGHDYTLSRDDSSSDATVLYREGGPNEYTRNDPGGPDNPSRIFISNAENDEDLSSADTATEQEFTTSVNPGALSGFPYEEPAPSGFEHDLLAVMLAVDSDDSSGTPTIDDFRLETREEDFLARANSNVDDDLAQFPSGDLTTLPWVFTDPPTIEPGQELDVFVTENNSGGSADVQSVCSLVFYRRSIR